jgi:hypothetical protein
MDRQEAERIYDTGKEAVIETLLKMDARILEQEQAIAKLTRNSSNSSHPKWWLKPMTSFPSNAHAAIVSLIKSYRFLH